MAPLYLSVFPPRLPPSGPLWKIPWRPGRPPPSGEVPPTTHGRSAACAAAEIAKIRTLQTELHSTVAALTKEQIEVIRERKGAAPASIRAREQDPLGLVVR